MFVVKRKQIIICALAVLVVTAGYLNFSYGRVPEGEAVSGEKVGEIHLVEEEVAGNFFDAARMEREVSRAQTVETLSTIAEDGGSEAVSKVVAEEEIIKTAKLSEKEQLCESLIKAKGYEDVVVFINDDKVSAVVKCSTMSGEDATKIAEIITEQTGIAASGIKITQAE